jgi:hypothetical protein
MEMGTSRLQPAIKPAEDGQAKPGDSCVMTIFGASGDLT